jgi:hypothetical protein
MAGWCTIRTRGQDHQDASVGPGVIPQCWRSGMLGRLHNWRTHPADLHPGRAQDDLRAQRRLMVQGRLDGWLLRASVRSLRTAPLAHSSGEARPERRSPGALNTYRVSSAYSLQRYAPPPGSGAIRFHEVVHVHQYAELGTTTSLWPYRRTADGGELLAELFEGVRTGAGGSSLTHPRSEGCTILVA